MERIAEARHELAKAVKLGDTEKVQDILNDSVAPLPWRSAADRPPAKSPVKTLAMLSVKGLLNWADEDGVTLLFSACAGGWPAIAAILLEYGADPAMVSPGRKNRTPLHGIFENDCRNFNQDVFFEIVNFQSRRRMDVYATFKRVVQALTRVNLIALDGDGRTALNLACETNPGRHELKISLVEVMLDYASCYDCGPNALKDGSGMCHLLDYPSRDPLRLNPFIAAFTSEWMRFPAGGLTDTLVLHGADPDGELPAKGMNALCYLCERGMWEDARWLVESSRVIDVTEVIGDLSTIEKGERTYEIGDSSPMWMACRCRRSRSYDDICGEGGLIYWMIFRDPQCVNFINRATGKTVLHAACTDSYGRHGAEVVNRLLHAGADPQYADHNGRTPLLDAETPTLANALIDDDVGTFDTDAADKVRGQSCWMADNEGITPVIETCRRLVQVHPIRGRIPLLGRLLTVCTEHGKRGIANVPDKHGRTPLIHLCSADLLEEYDIAYGRSYEVMGQIEMIDAAMLLVAAGADVNAVAIDTQLDSMGINGTTALSACYRWSVRFCSQYISAYLILNGADINVALTTAADIGVALTTARHDPFAAADMAGTKGRHEAGVAERAPIMKVDATMVLKALMSRCYTELTETRIAVHVPMHESPIFWGEGDFYRIINSLIHVGAELDMASGWKPGNSRETYLYSACEGYIDKHDAKYANCNIPTDKIWENIHDLIRMGADPSVLRSGVATIAGGDTDAVKMAKERVRELMKHTINIPKIHAIERIQPTMRATRAPERVVQLSMAAMNTVFLVAGRLKRAHGLPSLPQDAWYEILRQAPWRQLGAPSAKVIGPPRVCFTVGKWSRDMSFASKNPFVTPRKEKRHPRVVSFVMGRSTKMGALFDSHCKRVHSSKKSIFVLELPDGSCRTIVRDATANSLGIGDQAEITRVFDKEEPAEP